jgi:hypothetical protein
MNKGAGLLTLVLAIGALEPVADIKVTPLVADGHVSVSFVAPDAFTVDSRDVVKTGVPLTFNYIVDLRRPSPIWWDRTVGSATVAALVKLDTLTSVYQVTRQQEGKVTWSQTTSNEEEMRKWITVFDRIAVPVNEALEPNADYYLRVRLQARPHLKFSLWPWGRDDGSGRADFTFIR